MLCPRCGSDNTFIQQVDAGKGAGFVILMIILLFIPIIGWIALAALLISKNKTQTKATCQQCAYSWRLRT
jgi:predicted nucleic-acid-binding Zn-ribbon protein